MAVFWLGMGSLALLMTLFSLQNGANSSQELPGWALPHWPWYGDVGWGGDRLLGLINALSARPGCLAERSREG